MDAATGQLVEQWAMQQGRPCAMWTQDRQRVLTIFGYLNARGEEGLIKFKLKMTKSFRLLRYEPVYLPDRSLLVTSLLVPMHA